MAMRSGLKYAVSGETACFARGSEAEVVPGGIMLAKARHLSGIDRIAALTHLWFAIPLAMFGGEHFLRPRSLPALVPSYMPWRILWVYFVGVALLAMVLDVES